MTTNTPESGNTTVSGTDMGATAIDAGTLPKSSERASEFSLDVEVRSPAQAVKDWWIKVRSGDPGVLPSVIGLIVLGLIFMQVSDKFLSAVNIGNIPGQGAYIAVVALGLVFVLLLGEIDLSAGTAGGTCAAFAAVAVSQGSLHDGLPGLLYWALLVGMVACAGLAAWVRSFTATGIILIGAVLILTNLSSHLALGLITAICIGVAIGVLNGVLVAKVGIPSFVVTLALFLAWQGVLQFALAGQPVNTSNYSLWYNLTYGTLSVAVSWIFTIVLVAGFVAYTAWQSTSAAKAGLTRDALSLVALRGGALAVAAIVLTALACINRSGNIYTTKQGIPVPAAIAIVLMVGATLVLSKTTWGRHLYATGGNAEAARRAGVDVVHMKVNAFTICTAFGALGGIMLASSQSSASLDLGSGNVLLFSVAAAVIGGTSLFGGRGKPRDAIIGALVIAIIPNGLLLKTSINPQWQLVITGIVLLIAAAIDAISRRRANRS